MEHMSDNALGQINHCRVCGRRSRGNFLTWAISPWPIHFLRSPEEKENFYPLALYHCAECSLVQLGYTVDPKYYFSKLCMVTGTPKPPEITPKNLRTKLLKRTAINHWVIF